MKHTTEWSEKTMAACNSADSLLQQQAIGGVESSRGVWVNGFGEMEGGHEKARGREAGTRAKERGKRE